MRMTTIVVQRSLELPTSAGACLCLQAATDRLGSQWAAAQPHQYMHQEQADRQKGDESLSVVAMPRDNLRAPFPK